MKSSDMVQYKIRTKEYATGRSQKQYHLYADEDLTAVIEKQPNKNRFFNNAIREYISNHLEVLK